MWHLDTNIVIAFLNGNQAVATQLKAHLPDVAISSMVLAELLYGARASARAPENLARLRQFLLRSGKRGDRAARLTHSSLPLPSLTRPFS